jgi:asparagine synthase (glutamine-hydrolysing)
MCGIAGVFTFRHGARPPDVDVVQRMTDALAHRGPDGDGVWRSPDRAAVLGHRRLAIVDLSAAASQPMVSDDGAIAITYSGEVYNHEALRPVVESKGHVFRSRSDTEAVLRLYEERGRAVVDELDGMFAFAIYDGRSRELLLVRDRLGKKPLYYTVTEDSIVFASEIKAILKYPGVPVEVNERGLYHYLTYLVVPAPETMFAGIHKLPAGHRMVVSGSGRVSVEQYWEPLPRKLDLAGVDLDDELRERLERSVAKRLMSDVPVGVLFSGGVDSSLNAAMFGKVAAEPVRTFTVGFRDAVGFRDETRTAADMAALTGSCHHEVRVGEDDCLAVLDDIAYAQDEPMADPVCLPLYFVTRLARETGTPVVHVGEGADEAFCGYANYRRILARHRRWWTPLSAGPAWLAGAAWHTASALGPRRGDWIKGVDILRRRRLGQELFLSAAVGHYELEKASILAPDFRDRCRGVDSYDVVRPFHERVRQALGDPTPLEVMTYIELRLRLPELLLMRIDKMAMANAVEARAPFLDWALVEFALSVPEAFKLRDGVAKEPLKRLATRFFPRPLVYRPKSGFGAPIATWFNGSLGRRFRAGLAAHGGALGRYFDVAALERRSRTPVRGVNEAFQRWAILNFMLWYERFVVGRGSAGMRTGGAG